MKPRTTEHAKSLIDYILRNSPKQVIHNSVNEMQLSDHELI